MKPRRTPQNGPVMAPIRDMAPGQTIILDEVYPQSVREIASRLGRRLGCRYKTQSVGRRAVRVSRLAEQSGG